MRKTFLPLLLSAVLFASCNPQDKYTGVWNKDFNPTLDKIAYPNFKPTGVTIPVDTNRVKSPVFIRIKKHGDYYEMTCYLYETGTRKIKPDETVLGYVKFVKFDDYQLVSDNAASHMNTQVKVVLRYDPGTQELFLKFPFDQSEIPGDKKVLAMFNAMFSSGFHKVAVIHNKYETPEEVQKQLQEQHVVYE